MVISAAQGRTLTRCGRNPGELLALVVTSANEQDPARVDELAGLHCRPLPGGCCLLDVASVHPLDDESLSGARLIGYDAGNMDSLLVEALWALPDVARTCSDQVKAMWDVLVFMRRSVVSFSWLLL